MGSVVTNQEQPPGGTARLDARGLLCPLPVIRTQDKIRTLNVGDVLEVVATDPGVLHDIPAWCRVHGHRLLTTERCAGSFYFKIKVTP
ncbi:MAG: sulfurtransferase TusA family protein [Gammaproteobacteria bacterium]|nr:sulfurtransferase TusA family protein [Gammaproteobacteria bacterium]MYJ75070.1 sulfurtransferase TusA family protein [Gammaproteobacteria bacterium]